MKTKKIKVESEPTEVQSRHRETKQDKKDWLGLPEGQLTVDVYQTNNEIVIQSAVAGIEPEDLDITIENDKVIIRGERQRQIKEEQENYFYQECYWGKFSRELILPAEVDKTKAKAIMKNGILTIRMPKIEKVKTKKLKIE